MIFRFPLQLTESIFLEIPIIFVLIVTFPGLFGRSQILEGVYFFSDPAAIPIALKNHFAQAGSYPSMIGLEFGI